MANIEALFAEIDGKKKYFIERLREAVEIPSISAEAAHRDDVFKMVDWAEKQLTALGVKCKQVENGTERMHDGTTIKLPPILYGVLGENKNKKTLLIYGHLDVQPADINDGWNTEPFKLVEKDGKLFGRGSTDDKGPVIGWMNAIEVMQQLKVDIPVNIKFIFEGMEESGSKGLDDIIKEHKDHLLSDVDIVCISDNYWLGKKKPCITYGLRGIQYYRLEISAPKQDLHSGCFGGTVYEPMNDLVWLLGQLADVKGNILVDGIHDLVAPVTDEERRLYETIDFDVEDYRNDLGVSQLVSNKKEEVLMNRWRFPSLSIHGVEGAFYGPGEKTVIPCKVVGKFSIRLVPDMVPEKTFTLVEKHLKKLWEERGSPSEFKLSTSHAGLPWVSDFNHPHYQAAARALKKVFGVDPDFTREGGSIPVTLTFQEQLQKNVMLLPMGACDDMAHSQNEKLNISNYINGTKAFVAYLLELANI